MHFSTVLFTHMPGSFLRPAYAGSTVCICGLSSPRTSTVEPACVGQRKEPGLVMFCMYLPRILHVGLSGKVPADDTLTPWIESAKHAGMQSEYIRRGTVIHVDYRSSFIESRTDDVMKLRMT